MSKTVLITGASSGIGLELSKVFAKHEYNLVMVSQNSDNLQKAKEIVQRDNPKVKLYTIAKDLSEPSAPEEIFEYIKKNSIQVDILVNNAGIQVYGKFHETELQNTLQLMNVNIYAMTKLTRLFVDGMLKRGSGKILNVASTGAFQPCPLNSAYCASKAFVLYLSEALSEELKGTGVTVTTLCPGPTKTNFAKRSGIEDIRYFKGKLSEASSVAEVGYKALMKGKPIVTVGRYNRFLAQSIKFIPRSIVTRLGMYLMSRDV